jgi:hypothetical protein
LQPIPDEWLFVAEGTKTKGNKQTGKTTGSNLNDIVLPTTVYPGYIIPVGQRNTILFKWACRERGRGASETHIYDVLITLRDTYCEESENPKNNVSDEELRYIAKSVCRFPTNANKLNSSKVA